jgi:hypothetical protein
VPLVDDKHFIMKVQIDDEDVEELPPLSPAR